MFHPKVIEANLDKLARLYYRMPKYYTFDETLNFIDRLRDAQDSKGNPTRPLSAEETNFIQNELLVTKVDFKYWAEKYATINVQGTGTSRMYPLLETQQLVIDNIAELEYEIFTGARTDGILLNILKSPRQVGISTLAEVIGTHRATTQANVFGLIAADVPEQSAFMFDMFERVIDNLPWWLLPQVTERVKNSEIKFDSGTAFWVGAGKSVRGATGQRGNLGRGKTLSFGHLSELSTWDSPDQIDDALLPAIPYSIRSFLLLESTAKGQNNWWHKHWNTTKKGFGRFTNIFVPWYIFKRYSKNPPTSWIPLDSSLATARRVEETSPNILGRKLTLTKEQLYYYETTRKYHEEKGIFNKFLEEHGAIDDIECFQLAGQSIFDPLVIQTLKDKAKALVCAAEIIPKDLIITKNTKTLSMAIPPGLGVRAISRAELEAAYATDDYKGLYNLLLIWELPRSLGSGARYIVSVDIGDGIGKDKSIANVIRIGDIREPDEQVAQFVSDSIDPMEFAKYVDVIGRMYCDDDGTEALAAVETNNHGLLTQSELQNHLGYNNFYVWRTLDHAKIEGGVTNRIGWATTSRTRPQMLNLYVKKVKSIISDDPLYRVHSPLTFFEMATFITETTIGEAQAASNESAHDDCIMAEAIGLIVSHLTHYDEDEDQDSKRARLAEEKRRQAKLADNLRTRRDFANTDITVEEMDANGQISDYGTGEDWLH